MHVVSVKQGASIRWGLWCATDDDQPLDVSAAVVAAQVRDSFGNLIGDLTVQPGIAKSLLGLSADTTGWPLGNVAMDLMISLGDVTLYSETILISVQRPITTPQTSFGVHA